MSDFPCNQIIEFTNHKGESCVIDSLNVGAALNELESKIDKLEKELTNSKLYAERLENQIQGEPDY